MAVGNNASGRLYYSSNGGTNWSEVQPAGDTDQTYRLVFVNNSGLILCLYGTDPQSSIMSKSTDGGSNWSNISITNPAWVGGISTDGQYLFVATEAVAFSFEYRLFVSSNGVTDWTEVRPVGDTGVFWGAMAASDDNSVLLAGVYEGRLYLSVNGGTDWAEVKPAGESDRQWGCAAMDSDGTTIVTVGYPDAYVSYDGGSSWSEIFPAGSDIDIAAEVIQMTKDSVGVVISDGWTSGKAYLGVRE